MVAFVRLWFSTTVLATVDERKIINIIVCCLTKTTHPRGVCHDGLLTMVAEDFDGAFVQNKEEQSQCSRGAYGEGDDGPENKHQDEVNGNEKNNGHHPIDATAHLEPSACLQQVAWLRDQFRKHRDSPVVRIGPQNIR